MCSHIHRHLWWCMFVGSKRGGGIWEVRYTSCPSLYPSPSKLCSQIHSHLWWYGFVGPSWGGDGWEGNLLHIHLHLLQKCVHKHMDIYGGIGFLNLKGIVTFEMRGPYPSPSTSEVCSQTHGHILGYRLLDPEGGSNIWDEVFLHIHLHSFWILFTNTQTFMMV